MTIERVLIKLIRVVQLISHTAESKNLRVKELLGPLLHSLSETITYFQNYAKFEKRDELLEHKLARYWEEAAGQIRLTDPEFSEIFKSDEDCCWLNPSKWGPNEAKAIAIDLEIIRDKCRVILVEN